MSETLPADFWLAGKSDARRFAVACAAALVLELAGFAVLLPVLTQQRPPPAQTQNIVKLSIIAPAPVVPPRHVTPPPPLPPPLPVAPSLPPPPLAVAPHRPVIHHLFHPRHVTPPPIQPPPTVQSPSAPPPPAAMPAAPTAAELDLFQAAMRRAVQEAAVDPESAEMAHESGIVRVAFTYFNGVATDITVIASSGYPALDDAARRAVRGARYPPQPPDLAGRADDIVVDVIFRTIAADVDGD